jgi:hypothetical protein
MKYGCDNNMKKSIVVLGATAVILLMVSTATAVPTTNGEIAMKKIDKFEELKSVLEGKNSPSIWYPGKLILNFIKLLWYIVGVILGTALGLSLGPMVKNFLDWFLGQK